MANDEKSVFLSYSLDDADYVAKLRRALTRANVSVFDPVNSLNPGEEIETAILDGIRQAALMVFVVPRLEGQGKGALIELGAARALHKDIWVILPDSARYANAAVPSSLRGSHLLDASRLTPDNVAEAIASATMH